MSIATEIQRLQTAKQNIKTAIEEKGVTVPSSATIDSYSGYIENIQGGDGIKLPNHLSALTLNDWGQIEKISIKDDGNYTFSGQTSITDVEFTGSATTIPASAFTNCNNISSITMSDNVTTISNYAFNITPQLNQIKNVTISNNLTSLGAMSIAYSINCYSSNTYTRDENGICYLDDKLVIYNNNSNLTASAPFKEGTLYIVNLYYSNRFKGTSLTFPSTLKVIGYNAFYYSPNLESVIIPDSVVTIESFSFSNCTNLKRIEVGSGLVFLDFNAFSSGIASSTNKPKYIFKSTTPPTLSSTFGDFLGNSSYICAIYVPDDSLETYKSTNGWSRYSSLYRPLSTLDSDFVYNEITEYTYGDEYCNNGISVRDYTATTKNVKYSLDICTNEETKVIPEEISGETSAVTGTEEAKEINLYHDIYSGFTGGSAAAVTITTPYSNNGVTFDNSSGTMRTYGYSMNYGVICRSRENNFKISATTGKEITRIWVEASTLSLSSEGYTMTDKGTSYTDSSVGWEKKGYSTWKTFLIEGSGLTNVAFTNVYLISQIMVETKETKTCTE